MGRCPLTVQRGSGWSSVRSNVPGRCAVGFTSGADALHALRQRSIQPEVSSQASGSLPSTGWTTHGCSIFNVAAPGCNGRSVALEVQVPDRVLFVLRLWIGHCLWQDGTRALERALPTSKHSPDRACVLCSMHRLAWNTLETGLDETRATSSIVKAAIRT